MHCGMASFSTDLGQMKWVLGDMVGFTTRFIGFEEIWNIG